MGSTWLDRGVVSDGAKGPQSAGQGSGAQVREAMDRRVDFLTGQGLAERRGKRVILARNLAEVRCACSLCATPSRQHAGNAASVGIQSWKASQKQRPPVAAPFLTLASLRAGNLPRPLRSLAADAPPPRLGASGGTRVGSRT